MLRGNIAGTSLKMLLKYLYSVKCYDKLNMNVLTLSLWENVWWGLIYFDQFTLDPGQAKRFVLVLVITAWSTLAGKGTSAREHLTLLPVNN